jgi:hypothetical protein
LFNPIILWLFQSTEEYRELTFVMGSPIVFHTAPPQPASNARIICSPQFVGGADANQKGLRHGIPAKVVSSVGTLSLQPGGNANARPLAICNGIHYLASAVRAVSSSKVLRIRRLACTPLDENAPRLQLHLATIKKFSVSGLSDSENHQINWQLNFLSVLRYD